MPEDKIYLVTVRLRAPHWPVDVRWYVPVQAIGPATAQWIARTLILRVYEPGSVVVSSLAEVVR